MLRSQRLQRDQRDLLVAVQAGAVGKAAEHFVLPLAAERALELASANFLNCRDGPPI